MSASCTESHLITIPLHELGIWDFSGLADGGGIHMIDTNALARLPNLCKKVTARHKRSLHRLRLLVNGHDWTGQAPEHAFQSTIALPKAFREVKRGLSLADMGTHQ